MERHHALTKTTSDGRTVTISVVADPTKALGLHYEAHMDGEKIGNSAAIARPLNLPEGAAGSIGRACLTAEEVAQVKEVADRVRAELPRDLEGERYILAVRRDAARHALAQAKAAAYDEGEPQVFHSRQEPALAQAERRAEEALAAFDAEHPEVLQGIRERREADLQRRLDWGE